MLEEKNDREKRELSGEESGSDNFVSDAQKLVRKHLEDPDHVITDEDMKNIRVGMTPPEENQIRPGDEESIERAEKKIIGEEIRDTDEVSDKDRLTPWDTIDPAR